VCPGEERAQGAEETRDKGWVDVGRMGKGETDGKDKEGGGILGQ
jgi:hypothetical protein